MTVATRHDIASPSLSPEVRRVLVGITFSAVGSGLTLPFLFVYLSTVRGIETQTVGLLLAFMGLLGFVLSPPAGTLIDRFGPRLVIVFGTLVEALGVASLSQVDDWPKAFLAGSVVTVGQVGIWPATNALLTRMVETSQRERVYGIQFMLMNAGLGIGGLVSSTLVSVHDVASFERLYLIDAVTYLGLIAVVASLPRRTGLLPPAGGESMTETTAVAKTGAKIGPRQGGWGEVFSDRTLVRLVATTILVITFGYAQFEAGFAAYAVNVAEITPRYIGWAYAANTGMIVLGQLVTLRLIKGHRRSRLLALAAAIWSSAWVITALSGGMSGWWAVVFVVMGLGVFGIGETFWAPVAPAVINALAKEHLRGRYNALGAMSWTVASIIGPALAGVLLGNDLVWVWVTLTIGGTAVASLLFLSLGRHLTPEQNGIVPD